MGLLPIDAALLDLHSVDEDESEAVALWLVEILFAETNAHFRQHRLTREATTATASLLTSSVFDAVASCHLQPDESVDSQRFVAERSPCPEINDRHAARCLPRRSLEKPTAAMDRTMCTASPTQRSRAESYLGEKTRASVARRRRSPEKNSSPFVKSTLVTIPQTIAMPEIVEDENAEDKAWRLKCMRELSGESRATPKLGATSKWVSFARQPPAVEPRVSLEVEIIESSPPSLRLEVSGAPSASAIKMKSSLNTFSSISTVPQQQQQQQQRNGSAASSTSSRSRVVRALASASARPSLSGSQSVPTLATAPRKASALQLNDSLSRKRSVMGSASHRGSAAASTGDLNPWLMEAKEDATTGNWPPNRFLLPDMMAASASTIASTISLSAGVGMTRGESTTQGPERRDQGHTMSRKRFELHQRLAADHLLQESLLLQQQPPSPASHGSTSPLSSHKQASPRPYETVPPDPVPVPSLSPIVKDALVVPRNHLSQSASTPSLRVRHPGMLKRSDMTSAAAASGELHLVISDELDARRRARPSTALGAVIVTTPRAKHGRATLDRRPKTSHAPQRAATAKYLREFPKPHAGSIKLNRQKTSAVLDPAADGDSARQRMAWIS